MKNAIGFYLLILVTAVMVTVVFVHQRPVPVSSDSALVLPSHLKSLKLQLTFPPDYKMVEDADSSLTLSADGREFGRWTIRDASSLWRTDLILPAGEASVELNLYYCRDTAEGLCLSDHAVLKVPVVSSEEFRDGSIRYAIPEEKF